MPLSTDQRALLRVPNPPVPLEPAVHGLDRRDGLIYEHVSFQVAPGERAPGVFVRPAGQTEPLPAVIALHDHGAFYSWGRDKIIDMGKPVPAALASFRDFAYSGRCWGSELARRGFAVLSIDAWYWGERQKQIVPAEVQRRVKRAGGRDSVAGADILHRWMLEHETFVNKEILARGDVWAEIWLRDDMQSVSYLLQRPEVDPERIACVGLSGGGYRSALLSAFDDRVHSAVVAGWMTDFSELLPEHLAMHTWIVYIPRLATVGDLSGLMIARAPEPLLVMQCRQDSLFPLAGMEETVRRIRCGYRNAGAEHAFEARFYDVPHQFNAEMQEDAFAWLGAGAPAGHTSLASGRQ